MAWGSLPVSESLRLKATWWVACRWSEAGQWPLQVWPGGWLGFWGTSSGPCPARLGPSDWKAGLPGLPAAVLELVCGLSGSCSLEEPPGRRGDGCSLAQGGRMGGLSRKGVYTWWGPAWPRLSPDQQRRCPRFLGAASR